MDRLEHKRWRQGPGPLPGWDLPIGVDRLGVSRPCAARGVPLWRANPAYSPRRYLMFKTPGLTLESALEFLRSRRPIVQPNQGFLKQLKSWEKSVDKVRTRVARNLRHSTGF